MRSIFRPHRCVCLAGAVALLLASCDSGGQFCLLGYTTRPNYNLEIHTVRVAIFGNDTYYRDLEFQLTQAVIREVESKTPYKVVPGGAPADSELVGKINTFSKNTINVDQLNGVLDLETTLTVAVTWRDLRAGHIGDVLSAQAPKAPGTELISPPTVLPIPPAIVQSLAGFQPQIGGSLASAQKDNVDRLAVQIVSMMEKSW